MFLFIMLFYPSCASCFSRLLCIMVFLFPVYHIVLFFLYIIPDSKVDGANMGPIWGRQDPDGPHVGSITLLSGMFV